jgi:hypothetical protein
MGLKVASLRASPLLLALLAGACGGEKFTRVPDAEVDASQKTAATSFATTRLTAWAHDQYPAATDDEGAAFRAADTEAAQKASDKGIEDALGDFQSMTYVEAYRSDPPRLVFYRFKGTFSKGGSTTPEVRVVYDLDGKVVGFWVRPWQDKA